MSAVSLSNYQLGDLLGRGASGNVYRALNFLTGETVAIKSISLLSLPPSSLNDIMSEIDLLKNLNHANIVKYKGFVRDKENLFIVLEYCENGSLQTILKKFGKFPESLVAVYISQVLEGLIYLHEQGVIHRDIKGANILTNKDGSVKLADFGVSSRTTTPAASDAADAEVVGSPYWMAPEVIEQSGASTASDVWSVGCVVVELLEGKPPYGDLAPMQALWKIVQDESMRIPDGASPIVKDFLYHCFQKDPNLRVSAKKLLRHPWMLSVKKATSESLLPTQYKPVGGNESISSQGRKTLSKREKVRGGSIRSKKPMTVYDEAVQRVQQWNEALNASPKAIGSARHLPLSIPRKHSVSNIRQRGESNPPLALFALPSKNGEGLALTKEGITNGGTSPSILQGPGLLTKTFMVTDVLNRAKENESAERWDDDFASDIILSRLPNRKEDQTIEDINQKTVRPTRSTPSPVISKDQTKILSQRQRQRQLLGKEPSLVKAVSTGIVDDYSDMAVEENDKDLQMKLANLKVRCFALRRGLMHPDDIHKFPLSPLSKTASKSIVPQRSTSNPTPSTSSSSLSVPSSPRNHSLRSPPSSRQNSLRGKGKVEVGVEEQMRKYTEDDEEDYEDVFGTEQPLASSVNILPSSLQLTQRSSSSFPDSDSEMDPFAEIDDNFDAEDLEANLLRDKRATLGANISRLIEGLSPHTSAVELRAICDELLGLLENTTPEMGLESHFVSQHGMMAVLEVLESRLSRDVAVRLLKLVNLIVTSDVEMLESFCLIGGIPVIIPYTSKKHSLETRLEASTFIRQLTRSALTLQMFISCRGLRILVELLDEDYALNKTLILSSLEGINSVFELQSPTPRNDFVRMFVREGVIDPLSTALLAILKDEGMSRDKGVKEGKDGGSMVQQASRAIDVLLLFCQVAQADSRVREAFAARTVMIRLLKACELLPRKLLITAIKAVKHLSTSPQLIEVLQNSNAMEILVEVLGKSIKGSHSNEICSHLFQTIYSMTRLSKSRQEEAASSGIIPLLKRVIENKSPLKQFALPILCDLANAGKGSRRLLWQNDGLTLYLNLLEDPYWRVSALDAILAWMQDETARVEDGLLETSASDCLIKCFVQASGISFEGILDPFLKILRLSISLTSSISAPPFFSRLSESLERSTKAVIKLNLLRLTKIVCESHPDRATLIERFGLVPIIERLSRQDGAVLVRELAKEVLPGLLFGNDVPDPAVHIVASGVASPVSVDKSMRESREIKSEGRKEGKRTSYLRRTLSENIATDALRDVPNTPPVPPIPSFVPKVTGSSRFSH
nr:STE/STE11/CDC15 protein kinase [Cryptococcus depauperatus CBS 7855]